MIDGMINNLSHKIDNDIIYNLGIDNVNLYENLKNTKLSLTDKMCNNFVINDDNGNQLLKIDTNTGNFYIKGELTNNNELVGRYLAKLGQIDCIQLIKNYLSTNPEMIERLITEIRNKKINKIL